MTAPTVVACCCTYEDAGPPIECGRPAIPGHLFCAPCTELACIDPVTSEYGGPRPHLGVEAAS